MKTSLYQVKRPEWIVLPGKKWRAVYLRETALFVAMFSLTMLHEWMTIDSMTSLLKGFVFFLLVYIHAQVHRLYLFPHYFRSNLTFYITLLVLSTMLIGAWLLVLDYYWIQPWIYQQTDLFWSFAYYCIIGITTTFTVMAFSFMTQYTAERQKRNDDQLLMNEMTIKFLSAQLNPHFFFNMLNNLYAASVTEPERAPELIIKLSNLMRYQIETAQKTTVNLTAEIHFIENYIALEQERTGTRCEVSFSYTNHDESGNQYEIAPLLLITLVENAFKHSTNTQRWFVKVNITVDQGYLSMVVENSLSDIENPETTTGTGLKNLRDRLGILYPGKSLLAHHVKGDTYHTELGISLKKDSCGKN